MIGRELDTVAPLPGHYCDGRTQIQDVLPSRLHNGRGWRHCKSLSAIVNGGTRTQHQSPNQTVTCDAEAVHSAGVRQDVRRRLVVLKQTLPLGVVVASEEIQRFCRRERHGKKNTHHKR